MTTSKTTELSYIAREQVPRVERGVDHSVPGIVLIRRGSLNGKLDGTERELRWFPGYTGWARRGETAYAPSKLVLALPRLPRAVLQVWCWDGFHRHCLHEGGRLSVALLMQLRDRLREEFDYFFVRKDFEPIVRRREPRTLIVK